MGKARARAALVLAVGLAAFALPACRKPPRLAIERMLVASSSACDRLEAAGLGGSAIAASATALLERAPGFVPAQEASRSARRVGGQILVERAEALTAGPGGAAVAQVALLIELAPLDGGAALREEGKAAEPVGAGPGALRAALQRATQSALERAVAAFSLQLAAERKRSAELIRDLASPEPAVRDHAVRVLADRGEHGAVPALIARLRDADPEVSERALGALAQLRDARATLALIDLTHHRDPAFVAQIARILGDVGGTDARAWLLTMSSGNPDIAVRNAAREALADLEAREPSALAGSRGR